MTDIWMVMPFIGAAEMTQQAVLDCLSQVGDTYPRVLLIDQGSDQATSDALRAWVDRMGQGLPRPKILLWTYSPALPSLSMVWNHALDALWELGATEALVVNNDVRIRPETYRMLSTVVDQTGALFVSAVGVREPQYEGSLKSSAIDLVGDLTRLGGPDFSCYLITKACHAQYRFDEAFVPAYHEDLDYHRRLMLDGNGDKIFSVNLPYLHYASGTRKAMTPERQAAFDKQFQACRAYYVRKWGGLPNQETFVTPFSKSVFEGEPGFEGLERLSMLGQVQPITTPDLQAWWAAHRQPTAPALPDPDRAFDSDFLDDQCNG